MTTYSNKAVELAPPKCNKATAVQKLAEIMKIPMSQTMVCGDYINDIEMVQAAGLGIAVANALPEVKAAASYVCVSECAKGVIEATQKFIINGI